MAEYRPLGSEKLNQDEKLKRILELTYYNNVKTQKKVESDYLKESANGGIYAVVREKDGYYVKRGLNESSLDYIGGLFMKNKNRFNSYAEAVKRMELLVGNEQLQEATKYVLKKNTPQQEAPMPEPSMDMPPPSPEGEMPPAPEGEMPPAPEGGDMPSPEGEMSDMGGEMGASKRSDYMAEIQKYAGKLGQELRDQKDRMESDDIKYVLNMVISAVDLDKLELEDLEEIGEKFERDEEGMGAEDMGGEEPSGEEMPPAEEPEANPEEELGEEDDPMHTLERFVQNNEYDTNEGSGLEKYAIKELSDIEDDVVELDMNEIEDQITKSVKETLSKYFK